MTHPARSLTFDELWNGLKIAKSVGDVNENIGSDGLSLFCYSKAAVYERNWNDMTMLARGIILDPVEKRVVATPFPKFFNVGERADSIPDLPFEVYEKMDGSLIIIFHHGGEWRCATKGSLASDQAKWAKAWISRFDLSPLVPGTTYLAEAIYPENRIVVHYQKAGLTLLGAYREDGSELDYNELAMLALKLGWDIARRFAFNAMSELLATARELPGSEEGFVLRFDDGLRLKVKGDEYCRIHRLVSRVTPLAMWEAMAAGDDLEELRRQLPEEFWADFDAIIGALQERLDRLLGSVRAAANALADLSDKEVGLRLATIPEDARRFVFPYRKNDGELLTGRTRETIFRAIRPTGNVLPGYQPSYAMNRVLEEVA
ncbi:T4 RnlA family RNA ligase [Tundrisphaera sp. TA3]|uniref:T4 RnlA family RNA ligase n=1 Tax=Tundrisphaera sp. TA3 TaxID=3435775 RepID=UPI003EC13EB2